jgi:enoyl-CoA hydratase/carnithine racemase
MTAGGSNDVIVQHVAGRLEIVFNRPTRKNALSDAMYRTIIDALEEAERIRNVKVVVLSGEGGNFTAGHDLDGFLSAPPRDLHAPVFAFVRALSQFSKPVIATVEGLAVGIGTTMLLHCDLVYAAESARFRLPFVSLGLVPEAASSMLLPAVCGHQRASELLLLGETFSAIEAANYGLVNRILADGSAHEFAICQADKLCELPQGSIRETKALLRRGGRTCGHTAMLEHMEQEVESFSRRIDGAALREAVSAFQQKRATNFTGMD